MKIPELHNDNIPDDNKPSVAFLDARFVLLYKTYFSMHQNSVLLTPRSKIAACRVAVAATRWRLRGLGAGNAVNLRS